jgi:ankyrin repeat protein
MDRIHTRMFTRLFLSANVILATGFCQATSYAQATSQHKPTHPPTSNSSAGPPVPSQGKLGQELFMAVGRGDLAEVRALLKRGADPNARNGLTFVPLFIASAMGQTDMIEALLQAGAKVDATSPYGTALTFATQSGIPPVYDLLLAHGAGIDPVRADGETVLMYASRAGAVPIVADLVKRKVSLNAKDNDGATALSWAARDGQAEVGRLLIGAGASVDTTDSRRWTPLMYAAVNGHAEFVTLLLANGAKPNIREVGGRTALLLTATYGEYPEVLEALLKGGADLNATDSAKRSAYALAVARGHSQCAGLLGKPTASEPLTHPTRTATEAVQTSLKLVQYSMQQFNKRTGCISCHQEGLGRIATGAARDRGFLLDPEVERAQRERIEGAVNSMGPLHTQALQDPEAMKNVPLIEIDAVATGDSWLLAGMAAHKQPQTASAGAMALVLARQQGPDGNWHFAAPRVPMQSSLFSVTALSLKSIVDYAPRSSAAEVTDRVGRAKTWLMTTPAKTNEDRSFRLLGLKWAGASDQESRKAVAELRAEQRPDGGWAQLPTLQSDAYATGQALYALKICGDLAVTDPVYTTGVQFLLRTQDQDGSWFVNKRATPGNNYFDAGFPHGESQYSSFNGTCWAMLALLQTIDPAPRQSARFVPGAHPSVVRLTGRPGK